MKLPFNLVLAPILKPYLGRTRMFCHHPTFSMSIYYTYIYGVLGFIISANHLRKHLGELPPESFVPSDTDVGEDENFMLVHDLKIIATSMGLVQYTCLIVGCWTTDMFHWANASRIYFFSFFGLYVNVGRLSATKGKGLWTENPSLFIPHLAGQLLVVAVKILNVLLLLVPINMKGMSKLTHKVPAIILMSFNWLQEFCVFRQHLCICDL